MSLLQAAALGVVQGLTEFLPISSSAHLILVPWLLGWPAQSKAFDAALHLGTVLALLAYFWRDFADLGQGVVAGLRSSVGRRDPRWRLSWLLLAASLPAGLVGFVFEAQIEEQLGRPVLVALLMISFGLVMLWADRAGSRQRGLADVGRADATAVGLAQMLALAPGVSRSGVTITAGLLRGLERPAAARFSFLLSTPITLAAALFSLRRLVGPEAALEGVDTLVVGIISSALSGFLAIGFLLRFLQRRPLDIFVWYRVIVGGAILMLALSGRM